MRRLPRQRFFRGLMTADMATPKDLDLINQKMADPMTYKLLNKMFTEQRGHRWVNRLQTFAKWLWENREAILQILGLVIMFAEDGTPIVKDVKEFESDGEKLKEIRQNLSKRKPTKLTPHGEKVEDFTGPSDEVPAIVTNESVVDREKAEAALDELVKINQEAGFYDIGLSADESLHSGDEDDEVQPGESSGEATDRLKSDDV